MLLRYTFLGWKITEAGLTLSIPTFSNCCSNGQLTLHFMLDPFASNVLLHFEIWRRILTHEKLEKLSLPAAQSYRKSSQCLLRHQEYCKSSSHQIPGEGRHFRKHIRYYNSALAMESVRAGFVARFPRVSKYNPAITVHGRMYYEMGALMPPTGKEPRFAAVYIHDTEHAVLNRKHFFVCFSWNCLLDLQRRCTNTISSCRRFFRSEISLTQIKSLKTVNSWLCSWANEAGSRTKIQRIWGIWSRSSYRWRAVWCALHWLAAERSNRR